ncbi:SH3 domain-containing protein [Desulforamulus ferrireducens]|uniref:N-acetylmuramoyl-L-alanine amidase n=1 Tax=Desulforamulus ferrireducens TaxID=1833852 RepID=A0A1S6IZ66_9FIRM|nr:SH3 domain-containing protein [Desulforamulus ferrireducens]AQS60057.1 N-acetylmuramoyl-L-alanine amidase [Desulforamulus ferrireducens]
MTLKFTSSKVLYYALLAGLGFFLLFNAMVLSQAEAAQVAIVNVDKLNLRSGPGTNTATVGQVTKGNQLPILSKSGDWYQVQVGGKSVWVAGWLVKVQENVSQGASSTSGKVAVVTGSTLNIRSGPGTNNAVVGKVSKGAKLTVLDTSGDWLKVQSGNTTGWVASWLVNIEKSSVTPPATQVSGQVAVVNGDSVNLRSGPGTSHSVTGKVSRGERLPVISRSGDWVQVSQANGSNAWVASWLVNIEQSPVNPPAAQVSGQVAVVNGDSVNLRSGPGTSHSVAGQVSRGERLPVISRSGDWVQVRQTNGSNAWVAGWLVAVEEQQQEVSTPAKSEDSSWLPAPPQEETTGPTDNDQTDNNTGQTGEEKPTPYVPETKLLDVKVTEKQGTTYINVVSEKAITYNTFTLSNPFRYVVNINDVNLGKLPDTIPARTELVDKVRTGNPSQDPYISRLAIDLKKAVRVKTSLSSDKKTLTLEISKISYSDGLEGKTVFLDAGHGGHDNGASGQNGLKEKDVNLAITLKVAELLRNQGANVILSRDDDTFVDLYERTRLANEQNADIFVSIHSNANLNRAIGGTSTYFYAPASTPYLYEQKSDRERLARDVQRELVAALGRRDIGVLQSNFAVLRTSIMPSILIETAFISNAEEEALLGSAEVQQRAAEAIARGISAYFSGQ